MARDFQFHSAFPDWLPVTSEAPRTGVNLFIFQVVFHNKPPTNPNPNPPTQQTPTTTPMVLPNCQRPLVVSKFFVLVLYGPSTFRHNFCRALPF